MNSVDVQNWYDFADTFRYARLNFGLHHLQRFYFIENISFRGTLVIFALSCDVLATFRERIRLLECWVSRSGNIALVNPNVMDNFVCPTGSRKVFQQAFRVAESNYTSGFYVVGIINNDTNQVGAVSYYIFDYLGFKRFTTQIFGTGNYAGIDSSDTDSATFRAIFNPIQYITSCIYIPLPLQEHVKASNELTSLSFGWYTVNQIDHCWRLNTESSGVLGSFYSMRLFKHPQAKVLSNNTLNVDSYMNIGFHSYPWGDIALDTTMLMNHNYLKFPITVDPLTGLAVIEFFASDNATNSITNDDVFMARYSSQMGITVSLSQVVRDNYAVQTAIAQKQANVLGAYYNQSTSNLVMGAIVAGQNELIGAIDNITKATNDGFLATVNAIGTGIGDVAKSVGNYALDVVKNGGRTPYVMAQEAAANAAGTESIIKAQQPQVTTLNSGVNSVACYNYSSYIQYTYYDVIPPMYDQVGYPVCRTMRLDDGAFGSYVLCSNVKIVPYSLNGALPVERDQIVNALQTGCYLY